MRRTAALTALWRALTAAQRGGPGLAARMASVPRLAWASIRGRYDGAGRFGLMTLATLYVVSPLDMVPEILLGPIGLIDDGLVVAWIVGAFLSETERFLEWERVFGAGGKADTRSRSGQPHGRQARPGDVVDGEVIR
jgi:uncharacterized membrane protein YkvA (DUF1232 family)